MINIDKNQVVNKHQKWYYYDLDCIFSSVIYDHQST